MALLQRLLQLGGSLILATGLMAGAAFAESEPVAAEPEASGSAVESQDSSTVTVEGSGDASVVVVQESSSEAGPSQSEPASSPEPAPQPAPEQSAPAAEGPIPTTTQPAATTGEPVTRALTSNPSIQTTPYIPATYLVAIEAVQEQLNNPTASAPPAPLSPNPYEPIEGLLWQLTNMIAGTFVPATGLAASYHLLLSASAWWMLLPLVLLSILALGLSPVNIYTARLRAGGFLGAPRSDTPALNFFCHSTKMSFVRALSP